MIKSNVKAVAHKTTTMDFEKTGYARKLFESDIPKITKALQGIEAQLKRIADMSQNEHLEDNEVSGMIQDFFSKKQNRTKEDGPIDMD